MILLSSDLIDIGRAIGGFGALFYISSKIWRHIANAEAIDVFPLLRPFALGLCITFFPAVLDVMNGILNPIVNATSSMITTQNESIESLNARKKAILARRN